MYASNLDLSRVFILADVTGDNGKANLEAKGMARYQCQQAQNAGKGKIAPAVKGKGGIGERWIPSGARDPYQGPAIGANADSGEIVATLAELRAGPVTLEAGVYHVVVGRDPSGAVERGADPRHYATRLVRVS